MWTHHCFPSLCFWLYCNPHCSMRQGLPCSVVYCSSDSQSSNDSQSPLSYSELRRPLLATFAQGYPSWRCRSSRRRSVDHQSYPLGCCLGCQSPSHCGTHGRRSQTPGYRGSCWVRGLRRSSRRRFRVCRAAVRGRGERPAGFGSALAPASIEGYVAGDGNKIKGKIKKLIKHVHIDVVHEWTLKTFKMKTIFLNSLCTWLEREAGIKRRDKTLSPFCL